MTTEEIKKLLELPEHLDKWSEKQLESYSLQIQCKICGEKMGSSGLAEHIKECEKILNIKNDISSLHSEGLSDVQMRDRLMIPEQSISRYRNQLGLKSNQIETLEQSEKYDIIEKIYFNGQRLSNIEICKITGFSRTIVCRGLKSRDLESWTDIIQKEEEEIYLTERNMGLSNSEIMSKYGYSKMKVYRMRDKFKK